MKMNEADIKVFLFNLSVPQEILKRSSYTV